MVYNVVIVGAGMAGLGAATTLLRNNVTNFKILEAQDKAGGRIRTVAVGDSVIDLGAQWVHGVHTRLHDVAVRHGLVHKLTSDEGGGLYVRDDGNVVDDWLVKLVDFEVGRILSECENFVDSERYPSSVGAYLEKRFAEFVEASPESSEDLWELYDWHVRFQLIDNCCFDLNELSAREWGRYSCLGKDGQAHLNLKGGYQRLVDVLLPGLPLQFNSPVVKVTLTNDGLVALQTQDGSTVLAKHVIVTASLGVLKHNELLAGLQLPTSLSGAIESMGFGSMGKVFLRFERTWWRCKGFQLVWRRVGERFEEDDESWTRHISGFDPVLEQPQMLLGWVSARGLEVMERLNEEVVGKHCVRLLRRFLNDDSIPYPAEVYKTSWQSCKWIRGGYSHTTPACDRRDVGPSTLRLPVEKDGVPKVLLAGEAAHPSHFSTTHGAFESGEEQAEVLLKYIDSTFKSKF